MATGARAALSAGKLNPLTEGWTAEEATGSVTAGLLQLLA